MKPLFSHQLQAINFFTEKKICADWSDLGTGKTRTALELLKIWQEEGNLPPDFIRCLVICPKTLFSNWIDETHKWTEFSVGTFYTLNVSMPNIYLTNYEKLLSSKVSEELAQIKWDVVICDEVQKIKNIKAKRTIQIIKLFENVPRKIAMTGTPILNTPLDIFGIYRFLKPDIFGKNFYDFRRKYTYNLQEIRPRMPFAKWLPKKDMMPELRDKMYSIAFRISKEEALDLPDRTFITRKITLTDLQMEYYNRLLNEIKPDFHKKNTFQKGMLLLKLNQISSGFCLDNENVMEFPDSAKFELLKEVLDEIGEDKKVIIWAYYHYDLHKIYNLLKNNAVLIYGKTPSKEREQNIKDFKNKKSIRYFIGQPACAGLGLNLQEATYSVYASRSFSLEERIQSLGRNYRAGSLNKVTIIDLVSTLPNNKLSIDEYVLSALKKKEDLATALSKDKIQELF